MDAPFSDARWYLRPEVSARLYRTSRSQPSIRDQYLLPSQRSTAFVLQLFLKSVNSGGFHAHTIDRPCAALFRDHVHGADWRRRPASRGANPGTSPTGA